MEYRPSSVVWGAVTWLICLVYCLCGDINCFFTHDNNSQIQTLKLGAMHDTGFNSLTQDVSEQLELSAKEKVPVQSVHSKVCGLSTVTGTLFLEMCHWFYQHSDSLNEIIFSFSVLEWKQEFQIQIPFFPVSSDELFCLKITTVMALCTQTEPDSFLDRRLNVLK